MEQIVHAREPCASERVLLAQARQAELAEAGEGEVEESDEDEEFANLELRIAVMMNRVLLCHMIAVVLQGSLHSFLLMCFRQLVHRLDGYYW